MRFILVLLLVFPGFASAADIKIDGKKLFEKNCAVCHGDKGDGQSRARRGLLTKPRNFTEANPAELTRDRMIYSVTNGVPNTPMVAWQRRFSEEHISAIVKYIHDTFMKKTDEDIWWGSAKHSSEDSINDQNKETALISSSQTFPEGLTGNVGNGHDIYMTNCVPCHGIDGDGNGPRAYFNHPKPRNFLLASSKERLDRPTIYEAVSNGRPGSVMPTWSKVLDKQQIADVAEFVFQNYILAEQS